jgi:hypothetical protein
MNWSHATHAAVHVKEQTKLACVTLIVIACLNSVDHRASDHDLRILQAQ